MKKHNWFSTVVNHLKNISMHICVFSEFIIDTSRPSINKLIIIIIMKIINFKLGRGRELLQLFFVVLRVVVRSHGGLPQETRFLALSRWCLVFRGSVQDVKCLRERLRSYYVHTYVVGTSFNAPFWELILPILCACVCACMCACVHVCMCACECICMHKWIIHDLIYQH